MREGDIKKYNAVWIEWVDSCLKLPVWFSPGKLVDETNEPKERFYTLSYLVHENKKEYVLAASIHFNEDGIANFGQVFTIPKGCVVKIKKIKNI